MTWLIGGYIWLYIHRPFEYYTFLGDLQFERVYMLFMVLAWLAYPHKKLTPNRLNTALAVFTVSLLFCWFTSSYQQQGAKVWDDHWKVGVFYVIFVTSIRDEKELRRVLFIFMVSVGLYMTHSLAEYFNGRHDYKQATHRMIGVDLTANDPNTFAATLLHVFPYLVVFWVIDRRWMLRLGILGFIGIGVLCILFTGSRRGFLGLGCLIIILSLLSRHRLILLTLVTLLAPAVWFNLRPDLQNRFMTLIDKSYGPPVAHGSEKFRYEAWTIGLNLWDRNPLTGLGPGGFEPASGRGLQPHNLYAQVVSEMGFVGIFSFGYLVLAFFLNLWEVRTLYARHGWPPHDFLDETTRSTFLAVVLLLLMGLGGHNLYRYNWMWFAAFQVLATSCVRERAEAERVAQENPLVDDPEPEPEETPIGYSYPAAA